MKLRLSCFKLIVGQKKRGTGVEPVALAEENLTVNAVTNYQTDCKIQQQAFQVLHQSFGVVDSIRFMQQYEKDCGNYTLDRQEWKKAYIVDSLFDEINSSNPTI